MLPPSHEFRVMCKGIKSSDIELVYNFWESVIDSFLGFGSKGGGDGTLL
jgi:hypothetical protein